MLENKLIEDDCQVLRGTIERITFRNPDNGYSILDVTLTESAQRVTVVGICIHVQLRGTIVAKGEFKEHPRFGRQFAATLITPIEPSSSDEIERYLASGAIKGIGEGTAKRIVAAFGEKTLEVVLKEPQKLARIPGIGKAKARTIAQAFAEQTTLQQILQYLIAHRVSSSLANRIYARYGDRAIDILNEDPYILARDLKGIGFRRADQIALEGLKLPADSPQRVKAGLLYALEKAAEDGHCYLPKAQLIEEGEKLLSVADMSLIATQLEALIQEGMVICDADAVYATELLHAEKTLSEFVASRSQILRIPVIPPSEISKSVEQAEQTLGLSFSEEQKKAVEISVWYRLLVITGGPGCGKTTLIKALSHLFRSEGKQLILAAPTGRAAQRMSQVCDYPASTIHRLLKFTRGGFEHGPDNPLRADVLVIDETSMVDIFLAKALVAALPSTCTLILVGDKDQLPSVGPGRVFADLLASPSVQRVFLSQLFRRESSSSINRIAHLINSGVVPTVPEPDGVTKVDAYFLPQSDQEEAAALVERLLADQLPKKFGLDHQDVMVLTPSNRGPLGVTALNHRLQARLNPPLDDLKGSEITAGELTLRVGDRVVQRVNNYNIHEAGVFNGDAGIVYDIDHTEKKVKVDLWDGRIISYGFSELHQLSLAYAMTVHRSQGTEIPCIVLVLHDSHYTMLERQLVYTGITRAKKLLIIVGSKRALAISAKRTTALDRFSKLHDRIGDLVN